MQPYETYCGNFMLRHPYRIEGITALGAAVQGDRDRMQDLVNRTLNCHGRHRRYVVAARTVFFTFMRMERMFSANDPGAGCFSETELNVAMLLVAADMPPRVVTYMPCLWLDSGPALIAGRDIFGYPKQLGEVTMPAAIGGTAELEARTTVLHRPGQGPASDCTILRMRRTDAATLEKKNVATTELGALEILLESILDLDIKSLDQFGLGWPGIQIDDLSMAWMRQLPSIADSSMASFRSAAEGRFDVSIRSAGLLAGDYEVHIPAHHSVRLAEELGLAAPRQDVTLTAAAAYHMDFDLTLHAGRDLWVEI